MSTSVIIAFGLTLLAGLATGIGSCIAFFAKQTNYRFLSVATGFSAGVMLYVSLVEIFPKGHLSFAESFPDKTAYLLTTLSFFIGILIIGLIDMFIPSAENPHETHNIEELEQLHHEHPSIALHNEKLKRMGLFTAIAIAIHNLPEGLATFMAALSDPSLGVAIAVAIALHNIPEGISVSVPIYYATGSRKRAFWYSFISGLAEPFGAVFAYCVIWLIAGTFSDVVSPCLTGGMFAAVAGVMVYISIDELLPTSRAYGKEHDCVIGFVAGMLLMAISLVIMR